MALPGRAAINRRHAQPHRSWVMTTVVMLAALSPVLGLFVLVLLALLLVGPLVLGAVLIQERQVGIVVKRFGTRALPPGRFIALAGEAGYQADTLAPGLHFGYWRWQYRIIKVSVTVVPQGEIALVLAADGVAIPPERILGKVVDSDNFQDARKFLLNGGEKGRQLGILAAGMYRINTALFTVITSATAQEHGMFPVQAIDTLIGDINPPATLMETQTDRKIAEEQRKTYEVQEAAPKQRQQLVRQTSLADIQQQVVGVEQGREFGRLGQALASCFDVVLSSRRKSSTRYSTAA